MKVGHPYYTPQQRAKKAAYTRRYQHKHACFDSMYKALLGLAPLFDYPPKGYEKECAEAAKALAKAKEGLK